MNEGSWTALVLAGQRPGENSFAQAHGQQYKALIPVAGEPMLERVVRTLLDCASIGRIVILAQHPERLIEGPLGWMAAHPKIGSAESKEGISTSIAAVAGTTVASFPLLVVTADHALLTPGMVEAFLANRGDADAAVGVVSRETVEAAYPQSRRTWLRFRDEDVSGANLFALATPAARKGLDIWSSVERDRKKAVRLMFYFGPWLAIRALTRSITLDAVLDHIGHRAGLRLRAVRLPMAEAAIDVDKQADLELAEEILARQGR